MAFGAKIKLSVDTSDVSTFRAEIQKYVNEATKSNPIRIDKVSFEVPNPKTQLNLISKQLSEAGGITVKLKEVNASAAIDKLRSDIQYMLRGLNIVGLKEFLKTDDIDKAANSINKVKQSANEWASQMKVVNDIQNKLGSTYKSALSGNQMITDTAKMSGITAEYTKWQQKVEALRNSKVALSANTLTALQQEGIAIQQNITSEQRKQAEQVRSANTSKKASAENAANAKREIALTQQIVSLKAQIQRYILSNSKAYKLYKNEINALLGSLKIDSGMTVEKLRQIKTQFTEIQISARNAGKTGNSFFNTLKKGWEKFGGWSLVTRSMMTAYRTIKNMVVAVRELDTAMTELKKVTDLSEESYKNYLATATQTSKQIGASLSNTVSATADFARLGYDIGESASLAEAALIYKNVGDGIDDISEASESLISTIKAFEQFGITANDSMSIIDKFNEVGNNFAISSEGIGVALQKSASSLASANNNLDESIALITAMNAVVQNPEVVGTALKSVSMYLRAAKTEAEEAGESTEGMANSVSELREKILTLTNNKVDIMIDDSTFKSTYQIMKELSSVWNELSDIDTANILELIGGKRNATAVTSLITNFKDAEAALKTSMNAMGSATAENEKYLDSINGKLNILKSTFEDLSQSIIDSEFIKLIVSSVTKLISFLDILVDKFGALPVLVTSASMGLSVFGKGIKVFSVAEKELAIFGSKISDISDRFKLAKSSSIGFFGSLISSFDANLDFRNENISRYNKTLSKSTGLQSFFMKSIEGSDSTLADYFKSLNGAQASLKGFHEYSMKAGVQAGVLSIKSKLAATGLRLFSTALNTAIGVGITLLIQGLVTAITSASKAMEEAASKAKELSEQSKALSDTQQQIVELKTRLSDVNITENEAVSIRKQLYEIQNDLIEQYGTEKLKIDLVRDSVDNLSSAFDGLNASQLKTTYDENPKQYSDALNRIYGKVNDPTSNIGYKYFGFTNKPSGSMASDLVKDIIGTRTFIETENEQDTQILNDVYKIVGEYLEENFEDYALYSYDSDKNSNYISFNADAYFKEHDYSRREIVKTYEDIISYLSDERLKIGETGKQYLDEFINEFLSVKNKIADDKYKDDDNLVTTYAQYLLSNDDSYSKLNMAYQAMLAAQTDYNTALTSGNQDSINGAMSNLNFAREELVKILNNKNIVDNTTQDGQAIIDFVNNAINIAQDLTAKETLKIKLEADDSTFKKEVSDNIKALGNGEVVSKEDLLNYTIKDPDNLTKTDKAFQSIQNSAESNNLSLEEYCDVLIEIGLLHGQVSKDSEDLDFTPILDMNAESMKKLNEEIDKVQSSFDTIKDVITDYNTTGVLSIDNLQKLLALDSEYIKLMFDENGSLVLNEQAYQDLAKAKLENIKLDMLRNAIDDIKKIEDEGDALEYLELQYNKTTEASGDCTEAVLNSLVAEGISQGGNVKKAVELIYDEYLQYVTLIDNTDTTFRKNNETTNEQVEALENQKEALSEVKEGLEQQKEALEKLNSEYEDSQDKINNLVDLTVDMLKQKYEDEKEIIEKQKTAYKDRVDSLKDSLEEEQDAYDRYQSLSEKKNDISTLQRQAYSLQGTTSVEGKQRLAEIQEELSEATQDLHDTQYENSIKDRQDALDQEYERKEKLWDKEIERIEEVVGNERQLRIQAMSLIDTKSNEFYNDLWGYVYKYTTKSRFEFNTLWNEAYSALDKYNFGQFTCMQIMDLLEQNIYNTGLQIDTVADNIGNVSLEIDKVSASVENLKKALEQLPQDTIQTPPLDTHTQSDSGEDNSGDGNNTVKYTVQQTPTLSELKNSIDEFHKKNKSTQSSQSMKNPFTIDPSKLGVNAQQPSPPKTSLTQTKSYDWYFKWNGVNYVAPKGYTKAQAVEYIHNSIPKFVSTSVIQSGIKHYAKGTLSSKGGLSIVDEEGREFILSQPKKGRYANLGEGSVVFTKEQTENLWNLSQYKSPSQEFLALSDKFSKMISGNYDAFVVRNQFDNYVSDSKNLPISQNSMSNANNSVSLPINITIHNTNGLNEKRLATELKNDIFREFRKYGSWLG